MWFLLYWTKDDFMKIQARRNVFETNSSTQHTLCIKKADGFEGFVSSLKEQGGVFTIPSNGSKSWYEEFTYKSIVDISGFSFKEKLDILVVSTLANYELDGFLESISMIQNSLSELGIKVIVDFGKLVELHDNYYWDDGLYGSISNMIGKDNILDFLFSNDCAYTKWCDECCGEPGEDIEAVWKRFNDIPKEDKTVLYERR